MEVITWGCVSYLLGIWIIDTEHNTFSQSLFTRDNAIKNRVFFPNGFLFLWFGSLCNSGRKLLSIYLGSEWRFQLGNVMRHNKIFRSAHSNIEYKADRWKALAGIIHWRWGLHGNVEVWFPHAVSLAAGQTGQGSQTHSGSSKEALQTLHHVLGPLPLASPSMEMKYPQGVLGSSGN